jgi:hypothetical protein
VLGVIAHHTENDPAWFVNLQTNLLPLLSVVAPVLTGLVSFLRLDEKSTLHHNAAARFASMKRELDVMIANCTTGCDIDRVRRELRIICEKWDALTTQAPALYASEWARIARRIIEAEKEIDKYHPRSNAESDYLLPTDSNGSSELVQQLGTGSHRGLKAVRG